MSRRERDSAIRRLILALFVVAALIALSIVGGGMLALIERDSAARAAAK